MFDKMIDLAFVYAQNSAGGSQHLNRRERVNLFEIRLTG